MQRLIAMKRDGAPVFNSERMLRQVPRHFREEQASGGAMPSRRPLQNFFILANGDVDLGGSNPVSRVGNIKQSSAREIWYGVEARAVRKAALCDRTVHLDSARRHMSLAERVRSGLMLLR